MRHADAARAHARPDILRSETPICDDASALRQLFRLLMPLVSMRLRVAAFFRLFHVFLSHASSLIAASRYEMLFFACARAHSFFLLAAVS